VVEHPSFVAGRYDTSFIDAELGAKPPASARDEAREIALLVAAIVRAGGAAASSEWLIDKVAHRVSVEPADGTRCRARVDDGPELELDLVRAPRSGWSLLVGGRQHEAGIDERANGKLEVNVGARVFELAPR
jgi:hypothetical protein